MDFEWIKWALGVVFIVIGYFLKDVFNRFNTLNEKVENSIRKFSEENGKLKGRIELLEQKVPSEITHLENKMELRLSSFEDKITDMKQSIEHVAKNISIISEHILEISKNKK